MAVFVLSKLKKPLMPCSEKRARQLLERGRAVVHRLHPFTIRLKDRTDGKTQNLALRIDPGSKSSGVGDIKEIKGWNVPVLQVKSMGRGSHQRTRLDKYGFPRGYIKGGKTAFGFQTGDIVRAIVPKGKKSGVWTGRVAIRATGSFNIQTATGVVQGVSHRHCTILQRNDGYGYNIMEKPMKLPNEIKNAMSDQHAALSHLPPQSSGLEGVSLERD